METSSTSHKTTVLYVDHTARLGGGEIALLNLLGALNAERFRPVVVLGSDGPFAQKLRESGIETLVEYLDADVLEARKESLGLKSLLRIHKAWACVRYAIRLASIAKRIGAKIIHTNSLKADICGGVAGRMVGIPVIWHIRDNLTAQYLPSSIAALFRLLCRLIPTYVVVNSKSTLYALKHGVASPKRLAAANLDDIEPSAVSANPSKYQVVYCGCAIDQFTNGSKKADGSVTVALVGRITEWKGQHIFLKAASDVLKQFKNVRFQIIGAPLFGEEEYEQRLHQMVETLHIKDSVDFLGFRTDIPGLLSKADILVHASTIGEPFGQVVVEGMAAGKPVIATDGGALPELILDGETGILVPMGNASKMADKIIELLSNSASAQKMGAAARARSQSLFDVTRTARKIEAIYDLILKRNSATIAQPNSTAKLIDTQETS